MDDEKELFANKVMEILGQNEINRQVLDDVFDRLMTFVGGEDAINAIYNIIPIDVRAKNHMHESIVRDDRDGFIVISKDDVSYSFKGDVGLCEVENEPYKIRLAFGRMLDKLNLPKEIKEQFVIKLKSEDGHTYQGYRIKIEKSPNETIKYLSKCIKVVNCKDFNTIAKYRECCKHLIEMIPTSRLTIKKPMWKDCKYSICEAFGRLYNERMGVERKEVIGSCCAKICDVRLWEFMYDMDVNYSEEQANEFWSDLENGIKDVVKKHCRYFYERNSVEHEPPNLKKIIEERKI